MRYEEHTEGETGSPQQFQRSLSPTLPILLVISSVGWSIALVNISMTIGYHEILYLHGPPRMKSSWWSYDFSSSATTTLAFVNGAPCLDEPYKLRFGIWPNTCKGFFDIRSSKYSYHAEIKKSNIEIWCGIRFKLQQETDAERNSGDRAQWKAGY